MKKAIYIFIAALVLTMPAGMSAETGKDAGEFPLELSLEQVCRLALASNPNILKMREKLIEQDGAIDETKAANHPTLSAASRYETFDDSRLQSFGEGISPDESRWSASVAAAMTVFSGGVNHHNIKKQEAVKDSVGAGVAIAEQGLLVLVHAAYYGAWLAGERITVQNQAIRVLSEQLKTVESRFKAGVGEKYDVTRVEVALANARPPLIRASNKKRKWINRLQELSGLPYPEGKGDSDVVITVPVSASKPTVTMDEAIAAALKDRAEVQIAQYETEAARRDILMEKRSRMPVVGLYAGYAVESDMFGGDSSLEGWSYGVQLSWNIFDGGVRSGRIEQSLSRARQVEYKGRDMQLGIAGDVRRAYYDMEEASAVFKASSAIIRQATEAVAMAQSRYDAGRSTLLEVFESRLELTKAQLEQSRAIHDMELSAVRMKRAMGTQIIQ